MFRQQEATGGKQVTRSRLGAGAVLVAAMSLVATACTAHRSAGAPSSGSASLSGAAATSGSPVAGSASTSASSRALAAPQPRELPDADDVISASTPQQQSVAVSQALFTSAPAVVVSASDSTSINAAVPVAEKLGVPLLVSASAAAASVPASVPASASVSVPASASPTSPTSSAAVGGESGAPSANPDSALDAEIQRLGCRYALTVGSVVPPAGVTDVTAATDLPPVPPSDQLTDTTVLVHAQSDGASLAATATARAAGAIVVAVNGTDPRADPAAISALAKAPTAHVLAVGADFGSADAVASHVAVASTGTQLPGGGQLIFPGRRFVALYGHPGGAGLGVLGAQGVDASVTRAQQMAAQYQPLSSVPVIPTFEIIATVAQAAPGKDGTYSAESTIASLQPWVDAARAAGLYVVLDLQPGRADPLTQAKVYAPLLALPDVGLAVDPEWALKPGQLPLHQIGSLDASTLNAVGSWLDSFTAAHHLPQKLFVLHQFRLSMIANESALKTDYDNLAVLIHMDGQGSQPNKDATWHAVVAAAPKGVPFGWKNFYKEDHPMLTPQQTMAHQPQPMMISYQ